jgi:thioredoxin reductase (NADPH)
LLCKILSWTKIKSSELFKIILNNIFDTAIIGSGPAGFSAVLNLYARKKKIILFGNFKFSAIYKAKKIKNYLGEKEISGLELLDKFYNHINSVNIDHISKNVSQIFYNNEIFSINCDNNIYFSKTIILATGVSRQKNIKNEEKFLGRGVSYCATCDGIFFRNKTICIISYDKSQEHEIIFLSKLAKKIYLFFDYKKININTNKDNVIILQDTVKEIIGENNLVGVSFYDRNKILECDGVFIFKKSISPKELLSGIKINKDKSIKINKNCETNLSGVYACGDCAGGIYQLNKAIGEAQIAAQNAAKFLDKNF